MDKRKSGCCLVVLLMTIGAITISAPQDAGWSVDGGAQGDNGVDWSTADNPVTMGINGPGPAASAYDYVIITTNDIVENSERLENFVYMKELNGRSVLVVTEDDYDVLIGQAPNGRADRIRQWLMDNYVDMGIEYVLLIGDPDPDNEFDPGDAVGDVPMKMFWPFYHDWGGRDYPSDYYYAELDGNWDLDGDGVYGEMLDYNRPKAPDPSMGEDTFSVEWRGKVKTDFNEKYVFHAFSDDGVQVFLDGTKIIDNWADHSPENDESAPLMMTIGKHDIVVKFRENTGDAIIRLCWYTKDSGNVSDQVIPDTNLYDTSDAVGGLDGKYYDNYDFTGATITRKDPRVDFVWATGDKGPGGIEPVTELKVGRIPVYDGNFTQLDQILGKIIAYETDGGDITWRKTALLAMQPLWSDTPTFSLGEAIKKNITDPAGFTSYRIYDEDYGMSPDKTPTNPANVVGEWKNGYGVVVYDTHGSSTGAGDIIDTSMVQQLDDAKPGIVYGVACSNGYPEAHGNLGFVLLDHGAIATIMATRSSFGAHGYWWTFDPTSDVNHNLVYYFTKRFVTDGKSIGEALWETKSDVPYVGANMLNYNIYGDPETYLLTTFPNSPPVADANGPYLADEGMEVTFDGSGSSDPEGDPLEYRWDLNGDGEWDTNWSSDPTVSFTWGDDYAGNVSLEVRDLLGFVGEDSTTVTVSNVAPTIGEMKAYIKVNFTLRVAGEKWHNVELFVLEDGVEIGYAEVVRYPGSPDDQSATIEVICDVSKTITARVLYTPPDDPVNGQLNGANPAWVNLTFEDGGYNLTQHTFNVKHADTWEWLFGVNQFFLGHETTFEADASDAGSDDLTFTWDWDDGTADTATTYFNDQGNYPLPGVGSPDAYPSPDGTYPFFAADEQGHVFTSPGSYNVALTVTDDDGASEVLVVIVIII